MVVKTAPPLDLANLPKIIQGGMGVAVSSWQLARAVSSQGQLGVVSGTGLDTVLVRRLQLGDPGGHVRVALKHLPMPKVAESILDRYYVEGGKAPDKPFKSKPILSMTPSVLAIDLIIAANFVEVFLAKGGHNGVVGINLLEKIQLPTVPSLFGAMLAGVDFVLMGAGIPRAIPETLDRLAAMESVQLPINVVDAPAGKAFFSQFDPKGLNLECQSLHRPAFLGIIASSTLALTLARKATGSVQGFVVEGPSAGGHNAPPRGAMTLNEQGEPVYGPRDDPNLAQIRELGLPIWLAGSYGNADGLRRALESGANGIQVGTAFAFCEESGLDNAIKREVIERCKSENVEIFTDPVASPTGFPFKVLQVAGSLSDESIYEHRERVCDLGYLREAYYQENGKVGFRCAGEPVEDYVRKGGKLTDTVGRKCLCNGLLSAISLPQVRKGGIVESPIFTAGDEVSNVKDFLAEGKDTYTAKDVIDYLCRESTASS
ncbi:nitronate monooxygenase [soil metagenome]